MTRSKVAIDRGLLYDSGVRGCRGVVLDVEGSDVAAVRAVAVYHAMTNVLDKEGDEDSSHCDGADGAFVTKFADAFACEEEGCVGV